MSEQIELDDLRNREEVEETNFGAGNEDYSLLFGLQYFINNDKVNSTTKNYFLGWFNEVNSYLDVYHQLLKQLPEYSNPKFIKYLFENRNMKITKTISVSGLVNNYEFCYNSIETDENTTWFKIENGQFNDFKEEELNKY